MRYPPRPHAGRWPHWRRARLGLIASAIASAITSLSPNASAAALVAPGQIAAASATTPASAPPANTGSDSAPATPSSPNNGDELAAFAVLDAAAPTPASPPLQRPWRGFIEGMAGSFKPDNGAGEIQDGRISLDLALDWTFAPGWRLLGANRLDLRQQQASHDGHWQDSQTNTLKELYLSWQASPDWVHQLGRINLRQGVALGYNPTDYFKVGALRSIVSIAPDSLRENRLGSGMWRSQWLWAGGAASLAYSPKLDNQRSSSPFSPDWAASNPAHRILLSYSPSLNERWSIQGLMLAESGATPQWGLNISLLANDATTLFAEYSGGYSHDLLAASSTAGDTHWQQQIATGATVTWPLAGSSLSSTLEYHYNGRAANQAQWQALQQDLPRYGRYRQAAGLLQAPPTQHNLFALVSWNKAFWPQLELSLMLNHDLVDHSHQQWLEARYHWAQADLALQWTHSSGSALSHYGAQAGERWQLLLRYYF
ncbi:hypothetical protein [Chitinibacter tainanensis]|uniref:hypothetical protein n=1 Tax=Chitinibacter tainanensis TaxID=230667 RepID=UPI0003FB7D90|nr:hypothetical protein [Chitinibacter tainanensis]